MTAHPNQLDQTPLKVEGHKWWKGRGVGQANPAWVKSQRYFTNQPTSPK